MYEYRATVIRVVDGDTLHLDIDLGLDVHVQITGRLARINSPEMGTPEGILAKDYLMRLLLVPEGRLVFRVYTTKDKREKYGRYLVTLYKEGPENAYSINQQMIDDGFAVEYDGGKR